MFKKTLLTLAALTVVTASAFAADTPLKAMDPSKVPAVLKSPQFAGAMEVQKTFTGPSGLTGWVVKELASNKQVILFSTADQGTVFAGILMDKEGNNLSAAYAEQHIPKPDYTAVLNDFNNAANVVVGSSKAKAEITVLYDVNCGFCKLMHKIVQPAIAAGELRVRYVPVAILGADSGPKGAAVLASKNPSATMELAVNGQAESSSDKALLAKVASNTALMKKHGFSGTPAVLYRVTTGADKKVVVSNGLPTVTEMFQQLGINGQIEALKADPQLSRYVN